MYSSSSFALLAQPTRNSVGVMPITGELGGRRFAGVGAKMKIGCVVCEVAIWVRVLDAKKAHGCARPTSTKALHWTLFLKWF